MTSLAAVCALALTTVVAAGSGPARVGERQQSDEPRFSLEEARRFASFPLFYAGPRVDGLPLVTVLRRADTADFVSFVYGDCLPRKDEGCTPPAEVQVWPACRRHLALYSARAGPSLERATIRGAPGAIFDEGTRVELQSGSSTVVVFADGRERALRIVEALRPLTAPRAARDALPPPDPGAVEGRLRC